VAVAAAGLLVSNGCQKRGAPCAELEAKRNAQGAINCFEKVIEAHPGYADEHLKLITSLTPEEVATVNKICKIVLQEYFGPDISLFLTTVIPDPPLSLSSVVVLVSPSNRARIEREISDLVIKGAAGYGPNVYRVIKSRVVIENADIMPSPGLTSGQVAAGQFYAQVMILPLRVAISPDSHSHR
jgi:hypothetical protein